MRGRRTDCLRCRELTGRVAGLKEECEGLRRVNANLDVALTGRVRTALHRPADQIIDGREPVEPFTDEEVDSARSGFIICDEGSPLGNMYRALLRALATVDSHRERYHVALRDRRGLMGGGA